MEPVDLQSMATFLLGVGAVVLVGITLAAAFRIGWKIARANVWKQQRGF